MPTFRWSRQKTDRVEAALESLEGARRTSIAWRRSFAVGSIVLVTLFWVGYLAAIDLQRRVAMEIAAERSMWRAVATAHYVGRLLSNAETVDRFILEEAEAAPATEHMVAILRGRAANNDALSEVGLCRLGAPALTSAASSGLIGDSWCSAALAQGGRHPGQPQIGQPIGHGPGYVPVFVVSSWGCGGLPCAAVALLAAPTILRIQGSTPADAAACIRLEDARGLSLASLEATGDTMSVSVNPAGCRLPESTAATSAGRSLARYGLRVVAENGVRQGSPATDLYFWLCLVATGAVLGAAALLLWLHRQHASATRKVLRMRRRLRRAHERLETQVAHRTRELARANEDLQAYGSRVAHDVKGPLVAIKAFAHALAPALTRHGTDRERQHLARIQDSAQQMLDVADSLLLIGRVQGFEAPGEPVDIGRLARDVLEELAARSDGDVTYSWQVDKGIIVPGDRTLLRQAMENLLTNAWKFSAPTGHVRIEVGCDRPEPPGRRTFHVRDHGIGFDRRAATGLFQPFARFHSHENHPGSGIGLAIVHRIIQLHGGTIECESAPGKGTTFLIELPLVEGDSSSG